MAKFKVFIGSSTNGLNTAKAIGSNLVHSLNDKAEICCWDEDVFIDEQPFLNNLEIIKNSFDFAIIVIDPEDLPGDKDQFHESPMESLLLQVGLFVGSIGIERTFVICALSIKARLSLMYKGLRLITFDQNIDD